MNKLNPGQLLGVLANVGVIAGIALLVFELNQNTDQLRVQLLLGANEKIFENNRDLLGQDSTSIYAKSITNPEELTFEEFLVASAMVFNFVNEWEDR